MGLENDAHRSDRRIYQHDQSRRTTVVGVIAAAVLSASAMVHRASQVERERQLYSDTLEKVIMLADRNGDNALDPREWSAVYEALHHKANGKPRRLSRYELMDYMRICEGENER